MRPDRALVLALPLLFACGRSAPPPTPPTTPPPLTVGAPPSAASAEPVSTAKPGPPTAEEMICQGSGPKVARVCSVSAITPAVKAALEVDPDRGHLLVAFRPTATQADFETVSQLLWVTHVSIKGAKAITSLGPLAELTALRKVNLSDSGITSLGPLRKATEIDKLEAAGCPLADGDLSALAGMHRLKYLDLARSGDKLADASTLADLADLDLVNLTGAPIAGIDFVARLPKLTRFFAPAKVIDLSPLASAPSLKALTIESSRPRDFKPIAKLSSLTSLALVDTGMKDASPIAALDALETLSLANDPVTSMAPLAKLTKLRSLDVSGTKVTSVAPIAKLPIQWLDLRGAPIKDWKALGAMTTLRSVKVDKSALQDAAETLKKALPETRFDFE